MSLYKNSADVAEKQLKNISKSMCYAKWAQVSMHLTNGLTHSCYHTPLHKVNVNDIQSNPSLLHNTDEKKQDRKKMLKGERPEGCSYCWKIEDTGNRSDRIYRSGETWAQNSRNEIFNNLDTGNINPRYVEVNFNQACNLKCLYCSPHLSTAWEDEIKKYGEFKILDRYGNEYGHNNIEALEDQGLMPLRVKQSENPYLNAFWNWWPALYRTLEVFRITGGEPLMDVNTFKVLDYIYENPNAWLEMSVTSNLSPPSDDLFEKFLHKVKKLEEIQIWEDKARFNPGSGNHWYVNMALKNFALFVSVDSVENQAEYIRSGLNFNKMKHNVERFLNDTNNTTVTFINTFNAMSVPRFKNYLEFILELRKKYSKENQGVKYIKIFDKYNTHPDYEIHPRQRVWFDLPLLRNPSWLSVNVLPKTYASYIQEGIDFMKENSSVDNFCGFYDFEIEKAERNLKLFLTGYSSSVDILNFKKYTTESDRRRNTNFAEVFPEFRDL